MQLRDYQEEAVAFLLPRQRAFVVSPAGSGKTIIAAAAMARKVQPGQHVVWLANTREQVEQAVAAIQRTPGPENVTLEVCCVAAQPESIERADVVVVDEAHHSPAFTWGGLLSRVPAEAVLWGFSATPWATGQLGQERNERLEELFQEFITIERERVIASGHLMRGKVFIHDIDSPGQFDPQIDSRVEIEVEKRFRRFPVLWDVPKVKGLTASIQAATREMSRIAGVDTMHRAANGQLSLEQLKEAGIDQLAVRAMALSKERDELVKKEHEKRARWQITQETLQSNEARNSAIVSLINQEVAQGHSVLCLVGAIEHGDALAARVPDARLAHSKLGVRVRRDTIAGFRDGSLRVLFATSLADEGLDVPRASRLVLAAGGRSAAKLEQRAGRVLRPFEEKSGGVIHDFLDRGALFAFQQAKARMRVYDRLGYEPEIVSGGGPQSG